MDGCTNRKGQNREDYICKERTDKESELFVFSRRIDVRSTNSAGAVADKTIIPMRAKAADYHSKTRDSLTAQSVTALSYSGISFSTIV